jgi:hypothetical protein
MLASTQAIGTIADEGRGPEISLPGLVVYTAGMMIVASAFWLYDRFGVG